MPMRAIPQATANRRESDIYRIACFISANPNCTSNFVIQSIEGLSSTAKATCLNHINAAIGWGWVVREGELKGSTYRGTPEFKHAVSLYLLRQNRSSQSKIGYNSDFLAEYKPNTDFLLSASQLSRLHRINAHGYYDMRSEEMKPAARRFMTDISFHSSTIEGVNAKYADTIAFLEEGIQTQHLSLTDATILRNHYNTIRMILEGTHFPEQPGDVCVSEYDIRCIHACISDGLLRERHMQGRLRHTGVEITGSRYIPLSNPVTIELHFKEIIAKANRIKDPWEKSFFLMAHLPYLQPFTDCNKRTARLACNIPLLSNGAMPISWIDVDKTEYADATMSLYEHNSCFGLGELYCQAYERSVERFELNYKSREPDRVEILYAKEISQTIKMAIVENTDDHIPANVLPEHRAAFVKVTDEILEAIKENEMVAGPYRIAQNEVQRWRNSKADENQPKE